jgi:hypothetical protein
MRKTIFTAILILSTMSCAAFMEDFGEGKYDVAIQQTAVALALTSKPAVRNDLLLGLYYYPLLSPPYRTCRNYNYLPTWNDVLYDSELDQALVEYEYKLKSINDMQIFQMELKVQQLIDDLKRAKED